MEHIEISHFASDEQRAKAITDLVSIEPPPNATPGPIGGGLIRHKMFKDYTAPLPFSSSIEMATYINEVLPPSKSLSLLLLLIVFS
jgi:hypothetical protein